MPYTRAAAPDPHRVVSPWWPDADDPSGLSLPECPSCGAWEGVEYDPRSAYTYCVSCRATCCVIHGKPLAECCPSRNP